MWVQLRRSRRASNSSCRRAGHQVGVPNLMPCNLRNNKKTKMRRMKMVERRYQVLTTPLNMLVCRYPARLRSCSSTFRGTSRKRLIWTQS